MINMNISKKKIYSFQKTASVGLFIITLLLASINIPTQKNVSATATDQPGYILQVRNVSSGGTFEGTAKTATLLSGQEAQLRMTVLNSPVGNNIDRLYFKAFFSNQVNPTVFNAEIKADSLPTHNDAVGFSVPENHILQYVPGTTIYDTDDRVEFRTRTVVPDINNISQLAFDPGLSFSNVLGGPNTWIWMYFKVKAVPATSGNPVIKPQIALDKVVANVSKGQSLDEKRTNVSVDTGETTRIRLFVRNTIAQSKATNVIIKDEAPGGTASSQNKTATVTTADAGSASSLVTINLSGNQPINVVPGSVVVKDIAGGIVKTLDQAEETAFFGSGWKLESGDLWGTFEFARFIEYEAKVPTEIKIIEVPKEVVKIVELPKAGFNPFALGGFLSLLPLGYIFRRFKF